MKTLNRVCKAYDKALTKSLMESGDVLRKLNRFYDLPYEIVKFCSDSRRAKRNKISFTEGKLREYREHIKNAKLVTWTRYKPLSTKVN